MWNPYRKKTKVGFLLSAKLPLIVLQLCRNNKLTNYLNIIPQLSGFLIKVNFGEILLWHIIGNKLAGDCGTNRIRLELVGTRIENAYVSTCGSMVMYNRVIVWQLTGAVSKSRSRAGQSKLSEIRSRTRTVQYLRGYPVWRHKYQLVNVLVSLVKFGRSRKLKFVFDPNNVPLTAISIILMAF